MNNWAKPRNCWNNEKIYTCEFFMQKNYNTYLIVDCKNLQ